MLRTVKKWVAMDKHDLDECIIGIRMIINWGGEVYSWPACESLCSSVILSPEGM